MIFEEVVACLFNGFAMSFNQFGINSTMTLLSLKLFQWVGFENSKLYFGRSVIVSQKFF